MSHNHDHHQHSHSKNIRGKKLLWVSVLNFSITLVQIIGGILSNSLSLLSDAVHNLGDSSALLIAYFADKIGSKKPDKSKTFGYKRVEIIAALFNGIVLISISIFLFYEAYKRFLNPEPIKGKMMFIIASFGLLANVISVIILNKEKDHNLNVKAAYLHLMGDTLSSVAVIIGGLAIWLYQMYWLDPVITVLVGVFIIHHTWSIIQQTLSILMQSTPADLDLTEIKKRVEQIIEINNIHHIHAWRLDDSQTHFEAHINIKKNINMTELMTVKNRLEDFLRQEYKIKHTTLQFEYECCEGDTAMIHDH